MNKVIVVTGASSGFGALAARALARASHMVYASMRETSGRNAKQVKEVEKYAAEHGVDLRAIELDVGSQTSSDASVQLSPGRTKQPADGFQLRCDRAPTGRDF